MHPPRVLSFRRATHADIPELHALIESAYRGEASRDGWTTEADFLDGQRTDADELSTLITGPATRLLLAHRDGLLVGCVLLREEPTCAYLGMLSVRPKLQSAGVGRALLEEAERVAYEELARPVMRMRVISLRDSLLAWYERRGYTLTGEREPFPFEEPRAGEARRQDLEFVVLTKPLAGSR